ncbi:hypothetical protein [Streptomyces sp. SCL15-4]|uniref:hypothetical protein n=1 Tax=Streptomyces sp. SCL15-4 TaxID=2967221 RepID=UPI002966ACBC|nr:hypothetical protein [Streptomyces sp. SCL15-4]
MSAYYTAAPGQPAGDLKCCGQPMRGVESGIYECQRCGCHVYVEDFQVEDVQHCRSHRR